MISRNTNVIDAAEREAKTTNDPKRRDELNAALGAWHASKTADNFDALYNVFHTKTAA